MKSIIKKDRFGFKILLFVFSIAVISYALFLFAGWGFLQLFFKPVFFIFKLSFVFLSKLVIKTFKYILPPVVIYIAVSFLTEKRYLQVYIFLTMFALYVIYFFKAVLPLNCFSFETIVRIPEIFLALFQLYIFAALLLPDFFINFLGGIFFIFKSLLIFAVPDIPFLFDDFGMVTALFIFIFFYLHTIVFIIKKIGNICFRLDSYKLYSMIIKRFNNGEQQ